MPWSMCICRSTSQLDTTTNPIPEDEWQQVIKADPELVVGTDRHDGEVVHWIPDPHSERTYNPLVYGNGAIWVLRPEEALLAKMVTIADRLAAKVMTEDGERLTIRSSGRVGIYAPAEHLFRWIAQELGEIPVVTVEKDGRRFRFAGEVGNPSEEGDDDAEVVIQPFLPNCALTVLGTGGEDMSQDDWDHTTVVGTVASVQVSFGRVIVHIRVGGMLVQAMPADYVDLSEGVIVQASGRLCIYPFSPPEEPEEGEELFERRAGAQRPGPYCNETSTEVMASVPMEKIVAWLEQHFGPLTPVSGKDTDYRMATEAGWTVVHLMGDDSGVYLGIEDTPGIWPSSLGMAQALADAFQVSICLMDDEGRNVMPNPVRN